MNDQTKINLAKQLAKETENQRFLKKLETEHKFEANHPELTQDDLVDVLDLANNFRTQQPIKE